MSRRFHQCLLAGLSILLLTQAAPHFASATAVFDDHFDGDSGGMPAGWFLLSGPGTAVDTGTVVTLFGDVIIGSHARMDPSQATTTLTVEIAAYPDSRNDCFVAFASPALGSVLGLGLRRSDGQIAVGGYDSPNDWQVYAAGYLSGYQGGAIRLTLELGRAEFTVAADSPPFSAGPIAYAEAFSTLTPEDLGSEAMLFIQNDEYEPEGNWFSIDRITVDVEGPTPVERTTLGQIKALFRR